MSLLTREQYYATSVYALVSHVLDEKDEAYRKRYGSMAHKLPVLIRTAGLVQAVEFVASRPDGPQYQAQKDLLNDLATVLLYQKSETLRTEIRSMSLGAYMQQTQQAIQALLWFKRYAQSVLGVEPGQEDGE